VSGVKLIASCGGCPCCHVGWNGRHVCAVDLEGEGAALEVAELHVRAVGCPLESGPVVLVSSADPSRHRWEARFSWSRWGTAEIQDECAAMPEGGPDEG
jgi:hypothetical protein